MRSEVEIFKAEYIKFEITIPGGTVLTFKFDNTQIRGDVEYKKGDFTEIFVSPNGRTSSMALQGGKEVKFTLRVYEDIAARIAWQGLVDHTQNRYSCIFTFNYFMSPYDDFSLTSGQSSMQTNAATINNAIIQIKDHASESIARGEGVRYPSEVEVTVREGSGLSLIQLPLSILSCTTATNCGSATVSASGSTKVDGSAITALSTGVKMRYEFGSFATAEIDPGGDATDIAEWTFISGSWGVTGFEKRIVNQIVNGNGLSFVIGVMAIAHFGGISSLGLGLTIVEGSDTSSKEVCNLVVNDYDTKATIVHNIAAANEKVNIFSRWWSVCKALFVYADDADEFDTSTSLVNRQLNYESSGSKVTTIKSSIDLRELTVANEKVTQFIVNDLDNLEILSLSTQLSPSSGLYHRGTFHNIDGNDLQNLVLTNLPNLRELYAVGCDLQQSALIFGTHNNLDVVSIDFNPVMTMGLLADINLRTSIRKLRIGNDSAGGTLTNPTFSLPSLDELQANKANISGACTINNLRIRVIRLADNPNMTTFAYQNFRSVEILDLRQTPIVYAASASASLREVGLPTAGSFFAFTANPNLERVEIEDNTSIQVINLLTNNLVFYFSAKGCTSLNQVAPPAATGVTYLHFELDDCNFDYTNANNQFTRMPDFTDIINFTLILTNNNMSAAEVDDILNDLDSISSSGFTGRSIDLRNNAAPTSASSAAISSLQTKGFIVNTD